MSTATELSSKKCVPCEGGVPKLTPAEVAQFLPAVPQWEVVEGGERIRRQWKLRNFVQAITLFDRVAEVAEAEQHHPDLHLTNYRIVSIEIWTHAIGGLSENDFILAAKIDEVSNRLGLNA